MAEPERRSESFPPDWREIAATQTSPDSLAQAGPCQTHQYVCIVKETDVSTIWL